MLVLLSIILSIAFILILFVLLAFFFLAIDVFLDLPYVSTKREKIGTIIKFARITNGDTVIDLGSGDGRLLFAAVAKGAKAIGYEINPFLVVLTRIHASFKGLSEYIKVYRQNLWDADLAVADVIFVYAKKKSMQKFEDFIFKNARKGIRVVANTNPFPNKKPIKIKNKIFLYKV